ncbi:MAG: hypothetical protein GF346_09635 [Candidatus Eisenbacteria bacterium]|nr:hypothetical protein [Candidatus Latescibacterota bacterium]MBD3302694.1 hypothetical protein [Candidatus Eisenbacteria bacterium]
MMTNARGAVRAGRLLAPVFLAVLLTVASSAALAQEPGDRSLVTLDAEQTPVNDVLRILADRSGLNIATSPEVQGRVVSIHLRNTPFDEALNLVVRAAGLGYERVGSSILVADVQSLDIPTGFVTRVFELEYANAPDLRRMLEVLTEDVAANAAGNRLVIRGSQSTVEQAAQMIERLDRKPRQILLEARLIEVNTSALRRIGIDWEKITDWTTIITEGNQGTSGPNDFPSEIAFTKLDETADYYRQMNAFEVALEALITNGDAHLLSSSKVVTLDAQLAEIFAGETVPVVITSLQSPGGSGGVLQTVTLEKIDVGVKLEITPRIAEDGMITTLVRPEISRIVGFVGPDDDLPQTSTRRATTLVRVRDGQKIYIGGLLSEETRVTEKRVPLLGSIPLLGRVFRYHRSDDVRLDLVIEITPWIVGDEGEELPAPPLEPEEGP